MSGGLYQIRNLLNGDRYIGRTIDFRRRWMNHKTRLRSGRCVLRYLQNAWNHYGEKAFCFEPLIVCSPEDAIVIEQLWLDGNVGQYNISKSAITPVKAGQKLAPGHVAKIAAGTRGKPKKPRPDLAERNRSQANRQKVSAATRGKSKPRKNPNSPEFLVAARRNVVAARAAQAADPTYAARRLVGLAKARAALAQKFAARAASWAS